MECVGYSVYISVSVCTYVLAQLCVCVHACVCVWLACVLVCVRVNSLQSIFVLLTERK